MMRRAIAAALFIGVLSCCLALTASAGADAGFAGKWETNLGVLEIQVKGTGLTGLFPAANRRIDGRVSADGRTFDGRWAAPPTFAPPQDAGRVVVTLSADGSRFSGKWFSGDTGAGGILEGKRPAAAQPPPNPAANASGKPGRQFVLTEDRLYHVGIDTAWFRQGSAIQLLDDDRNVMWGTLARDTELPLAGLKTRLYFAAGTRISVYYSKEQIGVQIGCFKNDVRLNTGRTDLTFMAGRQVKLRTDGRVEYGFLKYDTKLLDMQGRERLYKAGWRVYFTADGRAENWSYD